MFTSSKLLKYFSIYIVGRILSVLSSLALLPLFTKKLPQVEFGIVGILLTFIYLKFIFNFFINCRSKYRKSITEKDIIKSELFKKDLFCNMIILSYLINFVFRGINYFTPQAILLVAAIIFVTKNKEKIKNYIKIEN